MNGWFRFSADAWPLVAEMLTASGSEWPAEAMIGDLVYFEDRFRQTGKKRPGRGALCRRWNCTDHRGKMALRSEVWRDRFTKKSPANHQPVAKKSPAVTRAKQSNPLLIATEPPANHQPVAKKSPHARLVQTQTTDTDTDKQQAPHLAVLSVLRAKTVTRPSKMAAKDLKNFRSKTGATLEQVLLVAEAFRTCPHPLFARDVRAEGWEGGTNRSESIKTLLVQSSWDDRLTAAEEWSERGKGGPDRPTFDGPKYLELEGYS